MALDIKFNIPGFRLDVDWNNSGFHNHGGNKIFVQYQAGHYVGGDTIVGACFIDCQHEMHINGVFVRVAGTEKTHWHANDPQNPDRKIEHHEKHRIYDQEILVAGAGHLPVGHHTFPFQYQLPQTLPGSFFEESHHFGNETKAKVSYKIVGYVDGRKKQLEHKQHLHINQKFIGQVSQPQVSQRKSFMFGKGDLSCTVELNKNVYSPGETVFAKLTIMNESSKEVKAVKALLRQVLRLHAKSHHFDRTEEVHRNVYDSVPPANRDDRQIRFTIPPNVRLGTDGRLVHCSYYLLVDLDVGFGAVDLTCNIPISIVSNQYFDSFAHGTFAPGPDYRNLTPLAIQVKEGCCELL